MMKNRLMKWIGALLVLCLMLAMVGCTDKKDNDGDSSKTTIVGKWESEWDLSKAMEQMLADEEMEMKLENLKLTVFIEFKDDKTYEMTVDEDSAEDMMKAFLDQYKVVVKKVMEDSAKEYNMTLNDMLALTGYNSFDAYWDAIKKDMDMDDLVDEMAVEAKGQYKYEDGKLYMSDDEDDEIDKDEYTVVELEGKTMKWTKVVGADEEEESMVKELLPLTFKKK